MARFNEHIEVRTGMEGDEDLGSAVISVTDPLQPIHWNTRLHPGAAPPWIYPFQSDQYGSRPHARGEPFLTLTIIKRELYRVTPEQCHPSGPRRIFYTATVSVENAGSFQYTLHGHLEWFLSLRTPDLFTIPPQPVPQDVFRIVARLGANYMPHLPVEEQLLHRWPEWAELRISGADDLVQVLPEQSQRQNDVYVISYTRSDRISPMTSLDRDVFLEVVVNERMPAWQGQVMFRHRFGRVYDRQGVAGQAGTPTFTMGPSLIITPTPTVTHTPSPTNTVPPERRLVRVPLDEGPDATMIPMARGRTLQLLDRGQEIRLGQRVEMDPRDGERVLELRLPVPFALADLPLEFQGIPGWLAPPEIQIDGASRQGRVLLRPRFDQSILQAADPGQAEAEAELTLVSTDPEALPIDPFVLRPVLSGLQWRLGLTPNRVEFATGQGQQSKSVHVTLHCNQLDLPFPADQAPVVSPEEGMEWLLAAVGTDIVMLDDYRFQIQVALDPAHWPHQFQTAMLRVSLGDAPLTAPLSIRYVPAPLDPEIPWKLLAIVGGVALFLLLLLGLLVGRRAPRPAMGVGAVARAEEVGDLGDDPFEDLPPEVATSSSAASRDARPDAMAAALLGDLPQATLPEPYRSAGGARAATKAEDDLRTWIRLAVETMVLEEGDENMAASSQELDRIAEQIFLRMRPLVDRIEQVETSVHQGAEQPAPATVEDVAQVAHEVVNLREQLAQTQERLTELEDALSAQSGMSAERMAQFERDAASARDLVQSFEQKLNQTLESSRAFVELRQAVDALQEGQGGDSAGLEPRLAELSDEVAANFRQQLRFQARVVLASLPEEIDRKSTFLQLDRFTSRSRLDAMEQSLSGRMDVTTAVMQVLYDIVFTGGGLNTNVFRQVWEGLRPMALREAQKPTPALDEQQRTLVERSLAELDKALREHKPTTQDRLDLDWLAGEAMRLLRAALKTWLP